jgi:hypothetical protein
MKLLPHHRNGAPPVVRHAASYVQAFNWLDQALAENTRSRSNDLEKIDRLRLAVFGCLPETVETPE